VDESSWDTSQGLKDPSWVTSVSVSNVVRSEAHLVPENSEAYRIKHAFSGSFVPVHRLQEMASGNHLRGTNSTDLRTKYQVAY